MVSADTDFGSLLAIRGKSRPSFILLRKTQGLSPAEIAELLGQVLGDFTKELQQGCVLTVTDDRVRIRNLPIG